MGTLEVHGQKSPKDGDAETVLNMGWQREEQLYKVVVGTRSAERVG